MQPPVDRRRIEPPIHPHLVLRFLPEAWCKIRWFCSAGATEIAGFGLTAPSDPFLVTGFETVPQTADEAYVGFDDGAIGTFLDDQADAGRSPAECLRVWIHTHPGDSASPSEVDERTFDRVFGGCDRAVMFILARDGATYARLRLNGVQHRLRIEVPETPFDGWMREYRRNVRLRLFADEGAGRRRRRFGWEAAR